MDAESFIKTYISENEDDFIRLYILEGPGALKDKFALSDDEWVHIFDYLVFHHNLLYKTVLNSSEFFLEEYVSYGSSHLREMLEIGDAKYDSVWEMLFDHIAISMEGLYYHFMNHRKKYLKHFEEGNSDDLRKMLELSKDKYIEHWEDILNLLLKGFCDFSFNEMSFDRAIKAYTSVFNETRIHRTPVAIGGDSKSFLFTN